MAMDGIHAEHDQAALLDADSDDQVSLPVEAWGAASASRSSSSGSKRAASDMQLLEGGRLAGELSHHLQAERPRAGLAYVAGGHRQRRGPWPRGRLGLGGRGSMDSGG